MSLKARFSKRAGDFLLQADIAADKGTLALFGQSGSGKSMTLRCIAGVDTPDEGYIEIDGITVFDSERRINLPPQKRGVGLLFQEYALFPTMTAAKNIAVALPKEQRHTVTEILRRYHIEDLADLYPHSLSGGQRQRVALARMMAVQPSLILLDEPFSALDPALRRQMEGEMHGFLSEFNGTAVLVSHHREQVRRLADRVCIIDNGRTQEILTTDRMFTAPPTKAAAELTGCENFLPLSDSGFMGIRARSFRPNGDTRLHVTAEQTMRESWGYTVIASMDGKTLFIAWDEKWKEHPLPAAGEQITVCFDRADALILKG